MSSVPPRPTAEHEEAATDWGVGEPPRPAPRKPDRTGLMLVAAVVALLVVGVLVFVL